MALFVVTVLIFATLIAAILGLGAEKLFKETAFASMTDELWRENMKAGQSYLKKGAFAKAESQLEMQSE